MNEHAGPAGAFRREHDSLGDVNVPSGAMWGAQTERARRNFRASGLRCDATLITAYARVKRAAALANVELGGLDRAKAEAIVAAAEEVIGGRHRDQFPLDPFQAGAGTSLNMNLNEVLANRALELLDRPRGDRLVLSPNDDVNRSQSTNDTYPTALHLAVLRRWGDLVPVLLRLAEVFEERGEALHAVVKAGRTHLQDAVPVRLGRELKAYGSALRRTIRLGVAASRELCSLPIGGSAAGTGLNVPAGFGERVVQELAANTRMPLRSARDLYEAMQSRQAVGAMSGVLRGLALELTRIANDLRLLTSGPATGLAEISLPAVQPGSSIMPGKVNPTQAEALTQVAVQVYGNDAAVAFAGSQGVFQLNVYKPVMLHNLLESAGLLADAARAFERYCARGLEPDLPVIRRHLGDSLMLVTALSPHIGYEKAAQIAQKAHHDGLTLKDAALGLGYVTAEQFDAWVRPEDMTHPQDG